LKSNYSMKENFYGNNKIPCILLLLYAVLFWGCTKHESDKNERYKADSKKVYNKKDTTFKNEKAIDYAVEAPPFSDDIFPCTACHANLVPNPKKRELVDWHDDISAMFDHDKENRWCLDCHDLNNRDSLKLASGKLLDFKESYKLCGQCHGEKLRDLKVGVHGKRTGYWNGKKEYLLCVHCHNPHSPKFKALKPEPPPTRQEDIK